MNSLVEEPTTASTWYGLGGRPLTDELLEWPADLFALTDIILERTEGYRFVLSPLVGLEWPPRRFPNWSKAVEDAGRLWSAWLEDRENAFPDLLAEEWGVFRGRALRFYVLRRIPSNANADFWFHPSIVRSISYVGHCPDPAFAKPTGRP